MKYVPQIYYVCDNYFPKLDTGKEFKENIHIFVYYWSLRNSYLLIYVFDKPTVTCTSDDHRAWDRTGYVAPGCDAYTVFEK